jgi:hypothetical protein
MGYKCVIELESRAEHLGFVTKGSRHFYSHDEALADLVGARGQQSLAYQRMLYGYEKLGFGREYWFVERIFVLPVYEEGRRGD